MTHLIHRREEQLNQGLGYGRPGLYVKTMPLGTKMPPSRSAGGRRVWSASWNLGFGHWGHPSDGGFPSSGRREITLRLKSSNAMTAEHLRTGRGNSKTGVPPPFRRLTYCKYRSWWRRRVPRSRRDREPRLTRNQGRRMAPAMVEAAGIEPVKNENPNRLMACGLCD